jgi:hypothetical protein
MSEMSHNPKVGEGKVICHLELPIAMTVCIDVISQVMHIVVVPIQQLKI